MTPENTLYYGDNLDVLRRYIKDESIDLIYLDPPFKSDQNYNIIFDEKNGSRSAAQIKAFEDTWQWDRSAAMAYQEVIEGGGPVSRAMQAFRQILGDNDMLAYLSMIAPRLIEMKRVLKNSGCIFLHCDPTASHYLKLLMDAVFGGKYFINEIIWHYRKWSTGKYSFQKNHDVLLFYSKSDTKRRVFNQLFMPRAESTVKRFGEAKIISGHDEFGKRVPSKMEKQDSEGARMDDVWEIGRVPPIKQLFPTQKPEALLERIIQACSNEKNTILDPFCGCGTTIVIAQRLKRKWIGIDITHLAVSLIKHRLKDLFKDQAKYTVVGEPVSLNDAEALALQNRNQFQYWALGLVGARPSKDQERKGADKGVDGRLYFHDESLGGKTKQIIISVKSGKTSVRDVRDLRGVIEREKAEIGVLITLHKPTKPMKSEATGAGFYKSPWGKHKRMQILTIDELIKGNTIDYPAQTNVTFKKAQKNNENNDKTQNHLFE